MLNRSLTSHPESGIEFVGGCPEPGHGSIEMNALILGLSTGERKENKRHTPLMLSKIS